MQHKVFNVRSDKVRGGVKVRGFGRTARGTKFVVRREVVLRAGMTKEAFQAAKAAAIERMLSGNHPDIQ